MNAKHAAKLAQHKATLQAQKQKEREASAHAHYIATHPNEFCGYCYTELDDDNSSGFCSAQCEINYGECPGCGAPSRGNRPCPDCREY